MSYGASDIMILCRRLLDKSNQVWAPKIGFDTSYDVCFYYGRRRIRIFEIRMYSYHDDRRCKQEARTRAFSDDVVAVNIYIKKKIV